MADTASLVARVKTEGADAGAKQLNQFANAADLADNAVASLGKSTQKSGDGFKRAAPPTATFLKLTENLGNQIAILEEQQQNGARSAAVLAAQLKAGASASAEELSRIGDLTGKLYDMAEAETKAARAAANTARQEAEANNARQKAASVVSELENKLKLLQVAQQGGATAAATLANQLKAGSGATEEQKTRIASLTEQISNFGKESGGSASNGLSKFRNGAQQVGYQVQDMIVQIQGGTSAFVAIGQQGSQLAGAFGPGGAVLGAVIALASAVGGVLYKSLGDAEIGTKELADAQKNLQIVLQQSENGAYKAADAFARLIRQGASAAVINAKVASAQQASNTELKSFQQIAREASKAGDTLWYGNAIGAAGSLKTGAAVSSLNGYLDSFSKKMGISRDEAKQLVPLLADVQRNADAKTIAALATQTDKLSKKYNNQNAELVKLNGSLQDGVQASSDNAAQQKALATIVEDTNRKQAASNDLYLRSLEVRGARGKEQAKLERDLLKAQIAEREGLSDAERKRANEAADKQYETDIAKIDETEKKKADRIAAAADRREKAQAKREETAAERQKKAADTFLSQVDRTSGDDIARITATEQQKLEKLQMFNQQGLIVGKEFEQAKTDIQLTAEKARQKELDKRQQEASKKQGQHDQYIAEIQALNARELELIDVQQKAKGDKAKEFYGRGIINEQEYQNALAQIAQQADDKRLDSYSSTLSDTTSALKTALGEGNALYKAAAITETVISTYKAATAAYSSLAPIPIIGPGLGIAAAAAAVAAGMANVAKIRSAREQGGNLSAGQASTIAERGKPEIIMPASASRVRTAQQMKQIMGEDRKSAAGNNVVIVNQTTGRIDSVQQETDDEGRLRILIRETVSNDMQDSNSQISASRRSTRNQPGF